MAVHKDEEGNLEAACALGCSCLLSCGFIFGLFFAVSGSVLYIITWQHEGDRLYLVYQVIELRTFAMIVLCVGAALTSMVLCCVTLVKCSQYYIRKTGSHQADKNTPLMPRPYSYHYNTCDRIPRTPPPAYMETNQLP